MVKKSKEEKQFELYKKQTDAIIRDMTSILIRAHRKVDDLSYRKIMEKLKL